MGNKNESKATRREPQPSAVSNGRARKEVGHHTCRKHNCSSGTATTRRKCKKFNMIMGQLMQIATCLVIIVGTAVNASRPVGKDTRGAWNRPSTGEISCIQGTWELTKMYGNFRREKRKKITRATKYSIPTVIFSSNIRFRTGWRWT